MGNYFPDINCKISKERLAHTHEVNRTKQFNPLRCDGLEYISWKKIVPNLVDPQEGINRYNIPGIAVYIGITTSGDLIEFGDGIYLDWTDLFGTAFLDRNQNTARYYPELNLYGYGSYKKSIEYSIINENDEANRHINHGKPSGQGEWIDIAAGSGHFLALSSNGDVYSWGQNINGQIGNGQKVGPFTKHFGFGSLESSSVSGIYIAPNRETTRYSVNQLPSINIIPYHPHGIRGTGCELSAQLAYELKESTISSIINGKGNILSFSIAMNSGEIIKKPSFAINETIHGKFSITGVEIKNSGIGYSNINLIYNNILISNPDIVFTLDASGSLIEVNINDGGIFETIPEATIVGDGENADIVLEWTYDLQQITSAKGSYTEKDISLYYETLTSSGNINLSDNNLYAYITGVDVISSGSGYFDCHARYGRDIFPLIMGNGSIDSETIVYPSTGIMRNTEDSIDPYLNFIYFQSGNLVDYEFDGTRAYFTPPTNMEIYSKFIATTNTISPTIVSGLPPCKAILCDISTSFALDEDNNLYMWGKTKRNLEPFAPVFNSGLDILSPVLINPISLLPSIDFFTPKPTGVIVFEKKDLIIEKLEYRNSLPVMIDTDNYIFYFTYLGGTRIYQSVDLPYEGISGSGMSPSKQAVRSALAFCEGRKIQAPNIPLDNKVIGQKLHFTVIDGGTGYGEASYASCKDNMYIKLVAQETITTPVKTVKYYDCITPFACSVNWYTGDPIDNIEEQQINIGGDEYTLPEIKNISMSQVDIEQESIKNIGSVSQTIYSIKVTRDILSNCSCRPIIFNVYQDWINNNIIELYYQWMPPFWNIIYKIIMVIKNEDGSETEIDGGGYGIFDKAISTSSPSSVDYSGYTTNDFFVFQNGRDPLGLNLINDLEPSGLANFTIDKRYFIPSETGLNFPGYPFFVFETHPNEDAPKYNITLSSNLCGIAVEKGGDGFTAPPNVIIDGATANTTIAQGQEGTAKAIIEGPIVIDIIDGGLFYTKPPTITFVGGVGIPACGQKINLNEDGTISSISFMYSGLYSVSPTLVLTDEDFIDNSGKSAVLDIKLNGSVKYITIEESGINYQYAPQILIDTANNYIIPNLYDELLSENISIQEYDSNPHTALAQASLNKTCFSTSPVRPNESWGPSKYNDVTITKPQQNYSPRIKVNKFLQPGTSIYRADIGGINMDTTYSQYAYNLAFTSRGYVMRSIEKDLCSPLLDNYIQLGRSNSTDRINIGDTLEGGPLDSGYEFIMAEEGQCFTGEVYFKNPRVTARKIFTGVQKSGEVNDNDIFETDESWWDIVNGYLDTSYYDSIWAGGISGDIKFGHTQNSGYAFDDMNHRYSKYLTYDKICNRLNFDHKCLFFDEIRWESSPTISIYDQRGNKIIFDISLNNNIIDSITTTSTSSFTVDSKIHIDDATILFQEADIETIIDTHNKGEVVGVRINNPGYGYFDNDLSIDIDHNTGSGLELKVHLHENIAIPQGIAGISIVSKGENYTTAPVVTILNKDRLYKNTKYIDKINTIFKTMSIDTLFYYQKYFDEYVKPVSRSLYQVDFMGGQYDYNYSAFRSFFIRHDGIQSIILDGPLSLYKNILPKLELKNKFLYYKIPIPEFKESSSKIIDFNGKKIVYFE